jgi:diguanylate cyclase (GGDEF)-like protein/PAS domain S-box-containing protein
MRLRAHLSRGMHRLHGAGSRLQYGAIAFVFLVCLAVIAVEAVNLWQQRNREMADAWLDAANLARSLSQHAEDTVRTADVSIVGLAQRLQMDGASPEKLEQLTRIMAARLSMSPALANQVIIEASGGCTAAPHSLPASDCVASFAENLEFHRTHTGDEPHLGRPVRDRTSGVWTIPLSRRFNHSDGSFGGIVITGISANYLEAFYRTFKIGERGGILAANVDGTVLVRYPLFEASIGRNLGNSPLFRDYLPRERTGSIEIKSPTDGVIRLNSYKASSEYPLVVAVALAKDEVLGTWRGEMRDRLMRIAGLVMLIAALGGWLAVQIRKLQRLEDAYRESAAAFRLLAENSSDVIVRVGEDMRRVYVSPACREVLGYEPEELLGGRTDDLVHPDDLASWQAAFADPTRDPAKDVRATYRVRRKDGAAIWVEVNRRHLAGGQGFVLATRDVTSRKRAEEQLASANERLQRIASQDGLTGLANRRQFDETLDSEFRRASRSGAPLSLLMIDVDCFKAYNDRYGHPAGDRCLKDIAQALKEVAGRPGDLVARYGGEEIAIILPDTPAEGAVTIAERARAAVGALSIPHLGNLAGTIVTISIGVATLTATSLLAGSDDLVRVADQALYKAKQTGRDRVFLAEDTEPEQQPA